MLAASWLAFAIAAADVAVIPAREPWLRGDECAQSAHIYPIERFCRAQPADVAPLLAGSRVSMSVGEVRVSGRASPRTPAQVGVTLRAGAATGMDLYAAWRGPAVIPAEVHELSLGQYRITAAVYDPGTYELEATLMYENRSGSMGPDLGAWPHMALFERKDSYWRKAHPAFAPLCRPLVPASAVRADSSESSTPTRLHPGESGWPFPTIASAVVPGSPITLPTTPCANAASARHDQGARADVGRWVRAPGHGSECSLRWEPLQCRLLVFDRPAVERCVARGVRVLFVGDSHTREAYNTLERATGRKAGAVARAWKYFGGGGITLTGAGPARAWSNRLSILQHVIEGALSAPDGANYTHVVFNYAQWDLQWLPAERHLADWALWFGTLRGPLERAAAAGERVPTLIWRMSSAWGHRREDGHAAEYRTNAKIRWTVERQREYLQWLRKFWGEGAPYRMHDSFGISLPRFHETLDTHHFIGPLPRKASRLVPGARNVAELDAWMCGAYIGREDAGYGPRAGGDAGEAQAQSHMRTRFSEKKAANGMGSWPHAAAPVTSAPAKPATAARGSPVSAHADAGAGVAQAGVFSNDRPADAANASSTRVVVTPPCPLGSLSGNVVGLSDLMAMLNSLCNE